MEHITYSYDKCTITNSIININNLTINVPGKNIINKSNLVINMKTKYCLIGKNGTGKSTILKLLKILKMSHDNTNLENINNDIFYIEQDLTTMNINKLTPIEFILGSNDKYLSLEKELKDLTEIIENYDNNQSNDNSDNNSDDSNSINSEDKFNEYNDRIAELYIILNRWNIEEEKYKIKNILLGLGFTEENLKNSCDIFSGGWQMKISLARGLYLEPKILLLDEPTNHLDLNAILWLENYLLDWQNTIILVSHNIGFINNICDYIINIENNNLTIYKGNYELFKKEQINKISEQEKKWKNYNDKITELKKKKKVNIKEIENYIKLNHVQRPPREYIFKFNFDYPYKLKSNRLITIDNLTMSYNTSDDNKNNIYEDLSISFDFDTKYILVGKNGSGKSSLIKLINNYENQKEINIKSGNIIKNYECIFGYYDQQFDIELTQDITPIEYLEKDINHSETDNIQELIRSYLGYFNIEPAIHKNKLKDYSGGQKARIALIKLLLKQPHCLILDEITNHLDIETIEILIKI
jgi:ATPase subunit of ABC transporter with duplicated ATPase domains